MYMYCLLSAAVLAAGTGNVTDDPEWANSMRQMLFDYALTRGSNPPNDFVCSVVGKKHSSCHCWNEEGHPSHDQVDHDDCHMPYECLAYSVDSSGDLQYAQIASSQDIVPTLQSWNVPSQMYDLYTGPCQSEEFVPFNYADSAQLAKGALDVHIGVCRKLNGVSAIQIGWGKGSAEADRVVPMVRDKHKVPPGDCHGTERGMTERPYTSDELAFMTKGLSAFAYQRAAVKAQPVSQWPSFDNAAALGADAWGTYFKAICVARTTFVSPRAARASLTSPFKPSSLLSGCVPTPIPRSQTARSQRRTRSSCRRCGCCTIRRWPKRTWRTLRAQRRVLTRILTATQATTCTSHHRSRGYGMPIHTRHCQQGHEWK